MPDDLTDEYNTPLSIAETLAYFDWKSSLPKRLQNTFDYDLQGFFKKYGPIKFKGDQHMTDEFKKPNHATFSNESKYSSSDTPGGSWVGKNGDTYLPPTQTLELDSIQPILKALGVK